MARRLAARVPRARTLSVWALGAAVTCLQTAGQTPVTDWKPVFSSFYGAETAVTSNSS